MKSRETERHSDALSTLRAVLARTPSDAKAVKEAVEGAMSAGVSRRAIAACFPSREAWRRFRKVVIRDHGGFKPSRSLGIVVKNLMWPVCADDQDHPFNQAARAALVADGRAWGIVWSFPSVLVEPREIGACGMRTRAGFFRANSPAGASVVSKYQPTE